ncbi:MAG: hypothetical protein E7237_02500 [Sarcina sp.]|nr:hypothetical protein [Sarcina sp.]
MNTHTGLMLLISLALAFGIYGVVVQRGANLVRIDSATVVMAAIWGGLELAASFLGFGCGSMLLQFEVSRERNLFWIHLLAGLIFAAIGIRMLCTAFAKKSFLEHRMEKVNIREDVRLSLRLCIHGFFAGIACGLLKFRLVPLLMTVFVVSAAFAAAGYISGRAWGAEPCSKAYAIGGSMLCALSIALQLIL